jgi:interleukin-like EMT inducer protein
LNRRHFLVLTTYTLLTFALTYPLVAHIRDHVPGTATWSLDEYGYVWNNWWFKFAVFDRGTNPFYTNYLFYPLGTSLVLYAYTLLHVLLALPLQFAFGLIPAVNATVLFSFVASAFGMYLFLSYLLRVSLRIWLEKQREQAGVFTSSGVMQTLAACLGGIAFAFTSNRFVYLSLGHYNIVASEWLPFYLLFLFKTLLESNWHNAVLAGLFGAFALYTETTDGVLIGLLTVLILVFEWRLVNRTSFLRLALTVATAAILFAPMLMPTLNEIFASGYSLPGWGHSETLLVDLFGLFTPTSLNPLNRHWEAELDLVRQGISRFSDVNTFFVGYLTALLAIIGGIRFARRTKLWLAVVIVFAILSLGPLLHINGVSEFDLDGLTTTVPLPFLLLHYMPLLKENRVPNRYSILVTIGLAVLVAYAAWYLVSYLWHRSSSITRQMLPLALCVLLAAGMVVEHLAIPLPLTDANVPDVYRQIGNEPGDFTVLSVPLGWRNSFGQLGSEDTRTQYYQAFSHKFLLTGQIQRNPPILFDYFQRAPILSSIISLETYKSVDAATLARDRALASDFVYFFDVRYLLVNAAIPNRPPYNDTRAPTLEYLRQVLPLGDKIYDQTGTIAYKINQPPPPTNSEIDFGTDAARLYQGEGWTADEQIAGASANWGTRQNARIFIPIRELGDYVLTVRAVPFEYPGHIQTLSLAVNGRAVNTLTLSPGWNTYEFTLPRNSLQNGLNELTWQFGYLVRPSEAVLPNYEIGATGIKSPVDIAVQSTPEFGSIKIAGREVSPLKRGYNLAVIDPRTGALLDVRNFDTGGTSIVESRALTDFVSKLSDGVIVAGAVQEEAATTLGERAAAAIKSLGLVTDLRGTSGRTHAFIAVKGRDGGMEAAGEGTSLVSVGHSTDDRFLGVAFDWIRVTAKSKAALFKVLPPFGVDMGCRC